jgi:hypothetical protein
MSSRPPSQSTGRNCKVAISKQIRAQAPSDRNECAAKPLSTGMTGILKKED